MRALEDQHASAETARPSPARAPPGGVISRALALIPSSSAERLACQVSPSGASRSVTRPPFGRRGTGHLPLVKRVPQECHDLRKRTLDLVDGSVLGPGDLLNGEAESPRHTDNEVSPVHLIECH